MAKTFVDTSHGPLTVGSRMGKQSTSGTTGSATGGTCISGSGANSILWCVLPG